MKVYQAFLAYCWHVLGKDLTLCLPYTCMVVIVITIPSCSMMTTSLARCTKLTSKALLRSSQEDSHPVHPGHLHVPLLIIPVTQWPKICTLSCLHLQELSCCMSSSVTCHVYVLLECYSSCCLYIIKWFVMFNRCTSSSVTYVCTYSYQVLSVIFTRMSSNVCLSQY